MCILLDMDTSYSARVASEVRAEMARQGRSVADLAAWLGVSEPTARSRYRGDTELTVGEVAAVAAGLDAPLSKLLLLAASADAT